jgi:hypothetical protein
MVLGEIKGDDGLAWEADQLFRMAAPEKLVLVVPPVKEEEVRERWENYRQRSRGRLPPYLGGEILVTFSPSWNHHVKRVMLTLWSLRRDRSAYESALKAVLTQWASAESRH